MNKPVVALTITTLVLGSAAAWQLHEHDVERERASAAAPVPAEVELPGVTLRVSSAAPPVPVRPTPMSTQRSAEPEPHTSIASQEALKARQRRQAAEYLRKSADPGERAVLRELTLYGVRRWTAGLDRHLDLDAAEYERLVQLLADQDMEKREAAARCLVNPACVNPSPDSAFFTSADQAIRDIIGDEKLKELRAFHANETERRAVTKLQSRLPAHSALTPAQSDDLTRALFEEKRRQQGEMHDRQQHMRGYSLPDGPSLMYADDSPTVELALQSGEAYVQAMRDRAATQLAGEQLTVLNTMYDDLLVAFRGYVREHAVQTAPAEIKTREPARDPRDRS